jgi:hypothetical protein
MVKQEINPFFHIHLKNKTFVSVSVHNGGINIGHCVFYDNIGPKYSLICFFLWYAKAEKWLLIARRNSVAVTLSNGLENFVYSR